jgi:hypothetical protein
LAYFVKLKQTILTVVAIASGVLVTITYATAQSKIDKDDLTQVRIPCPGPWVGCGTGHYDRIAKEKWVEQVNKIKATNPKGGAGSRNFTVATNKTEIILKGVEWVERVKIDLNAMTYSRGIRNAFNRDGTEGYHPLETGNIVSAYGISADDSADTCRQQTEAGVKCTCDLGSLRPLQGAVGIGEVLEKKQEIVVDDQSKKKGSRRKLAYDPIKVVRGPDQSLYITDHHHGARAWLEAPHTKGTCVIVDAVPASQKEFQAELEKRKWVRLADEKGKPITWEQLPKTVKELPDDPYRTLAWKVRKQDGFCRALMGGDTEFAEFKWADWFRDKIKDPTTMIKQAVDLAKGDSARDLPGWNRGAKCPNDPNA